jgi:hypothetical protein
VVIQPQLATGEKEADMPGRTIDKAIAAMEAAEKLCLEMHDLIELREMLQKMEREAAIRQPTKSGRKSIK